MNILNKLTIRNLKLNKKRTIVTIIGIMLSVALIVAVTSMFFSARSSLIEFEKNEKGDYHVSFFGVAKEDIQYFANNRDFETVNYVTGIGYARLEEITNKYKPYVYVMGFTSDSLNNLAINLIEGRLPENDSEIIIPKHLKTNGHVEYHVGDVLTLQVGKRILLEDDTILTQEDPYIMEEESLVDLNAKTYKVVGIIERPRIESYSAPGYSFITYIEKDEISDKADIYVRFNKDSFDKKFDIVANLIGVDVKYYKALNDPDIFKSEEGVKLYQEAVLEYGEKAKYLVYYNSYLIGLESSLFGESTVKGLGIAASIVCVVIIFTSVFCIKNSFDISITEKIRQYGMLSSIGATHKQIRKNVFYEASILGLIGIPLGIILGLGAAYILIIVSNFYIRGLTELKLVFCLSWIGVLFSLILGLLTIYLSAFRSAHRASKIEPIVAIRGNEDVKINRKKIKSSCYIKKIFGVGGDISYKTIKRNRKKYSTTVISIIVCSAVFVALSYFISIAFVAIKQELRSYDYNISVSYNSEDDLLNNKTDAILDLDNIKEYSIIREEDICIDNTVYSKELLEVHPEFGNKENWYYDEETGEKVYYDLLDIPIIINTVGNESFKNYTKKLGLKYEDVKDKGILLNYISDYILGEKRTISYLDYKKGDEIKIYIYSDALEQEKEFFSIEIADITDVRPLGLGNRELGVPILIVDDEVFDNIIANYKSEKNKPLYNHKEIYINSSNPDKLQVEIENILENMDYNLNNVEQDARMMRGFYTLIAIFLYGFIIVIALIGITNIFNTITTNMELRKQEFAMLKSIGMTNKEFNSMIRLESLMYGVESLVIGIPLGCFLSYLLYYVLSQDDASMKFMLPYGAIVINIVVVFLLLLCLMKYSISKINKQNTIETIRNENI